jgi:cobalt/nickel transport system permease protein
MHLVLLDRWTELDSPLHRLDPRSKMAVLGAPILFLLLSRSHLVFKTAAIGCFLLALLLLSRVPAAYCLKRATIVLPFSGMAAAAAIAGRWLPGAEPGRWLSVADAAGIIARSYLCALAVLVLVSTTPLAALLKALEKLRVPGVFLAIVHFVYRYLFVLSEEAQHMNYARLSRAGRCGRPAMFRSAAGSVGVLFARSHARGERIHRAMLARGFTGLFPLAHELRWRAADSLFAAFTGVFLLALALAAPLA